MDMKLQFAVVALCSVFMASQANAAEKIQLKTDQDKLSYTKGFNIGNGFVKQKVEVDQKIFLRGVEDALSGVNSLMTTTEMVEVEQNFQKQRSAKLQEERKKLAEKNKKEGEVFLASNAKKEGVKTLASGLQYMVIKEGRGKKPKATDKVKANYVMTFIDGTVIDDSTKRPEPSSAKPVGGDKRYVPACWTEALQLMSEGSKWKLFCPSGLVYGEQGNVGIGPNTAIIFDVELISIEPPDKTEKPEKEKGKKN